LTNALPTTTIAEANQFQCNTSSFILSGNAPTIGTGSWSVVMEPQQLQHRPLIHLELQVLRREQVTLRWTITNGTCTSSTSDVILTNNALPTAIAGSNQWYK
jgi:hypothetical protein